MAEFDCKKCLHEKVCALWAEHECQDASCFCQDGCDYFTTTLTPPNEWVSVDERMPTIEKDYGGYGSVSVNVFNGKTVLPMDWESYVVRGKKVFR